MNIRNYSVCCSNLPSEDRKALIALLQKLGEPIYKTSSIFSDEPISTRLVFGFYTNNWCLASKPKDRSKCLEISEFLKMFSRASLDWIYNEQ